MPDILESAPATKRYSEKREALISAATRLFNEKGVVGTTLSDVGASVGLVKNSVTYYFRRKEDLAVASFMRAIAVHEQLVDEAVRQTTIADRVMELIRLHMALQGRIHDGDSPPIVMSHEIRALPEPQIDDVFKAYTAMFRRLRNLLQGVETADWPREHLNARTHLLLSQTFGIRAMVGRYEPEDRSRIAERFGNILLHGLGTADGVWTSSGAETEWLARVPERDLTAQFLRAATELINEQGYAGASVNRIAEKLNLTKGGFYYYNENKDDLIAECFERSVATIRKAVNLTEAYGGSAWDHLCSIGRGLVRFQLSGDGPLLRSTASSALPDPLHRARVSAELRRITERIAGVVVSGLMDGSVRPIDPALASIGLLNGITAAAELRRWVKTADEANSADLYTRPMLLGLLCPATT